MQNLIGACITGIIGFGCAITITNFILWQNPLDDTFLIRLCIMVGICAGGVFYAFASDVDAKKIN